MGCDKNVARLSTRLMNYKEAHDDSPEKTLSLIISLIYLIQDICFFRK